MADPSLLIQKRGRVKGTLTRVKSYAESIQPNTPLEDITARLDKIEEAWGEFIDIEDNLLTNPNQISELDEFETKYFDTKAILLRAVKARTSNQDQSTGHPSPSLNSTANNFVSNEQFNATMANFLTSQQTFFDNLRSTNPNPLNTSSLDFRLPRMNIPTFSGDYKEWPSFQDLFETAVDKNESLTGCQKLQYLKGLLKGEAASIIRHLTVTDNNYVEAWDKLRDRFNKRRHITTSLIKTFMDQHIISQPSAKYLRNIYDSFDEVIRGLRALGPEAESRDPWLIFIAVGKLDQETKQLWFKESAENNFPTFTDLLKFLNKRCDALETCTSFNKKTISTRVMHAATSTATSVCTMCQGSHTLYTCPQFNNKSLNERKSFVVSNSLCFNCLQSGHSVHTCRSKNRCFHCKRNHHTLLHGSGNSHSQTTHSGREASRISPSPISANSSISLPSNSDIDPSQTSQFNNQPKLSSINTQLNSSINLSPSGSNNQPLSSFNTCVNQYPVSLLPTAIVKVQDIHGRLQQCRVLLDSGSQISFISESCIQRLGLKRRNARFVVSGLGAVKTGFTRGKVLIKMFSRFDVNEGITVEAYIMTCLTSSIPARSFHIDDWRHLSQCRLADPYVDKPSPVDIIIGADKFFSVIKKGQIQGNGSCPIAQETLFGWVLCGNISVSSDMALTMHSKVLTNVDFDLRQFWEMEEFPSQETLSAEEFRCEDHFNKTFHRSNNGQFVVSLPFTDDVSQLGHSEASAVKRLYSVERRFSRDPDYKESYIQFMREYARLGHMEPIPDTELKVEDSQCFYLPHHAVFKNSPSPKIRVVFDGSCKSSTGISLNETLMVGPTVQRNLISILISFRKHKIAFSADIEKMYRQVQIEPTDQDYQRIVWREGPSEPVKHFRLTTVTYGTSSAPFLATRVLKQIAIDNEDTFPHSAAIILRDFYVDDLLSGADTLARAIELQRELKYILKLNGFNLTKWRSNANILCVSDSDLRSKQQLTITDSNEATKVLGLKWDPQQDIFLFDVSSLSEETPTKRRLLSESSRIFDPLGLLAPVVVSIKMLFQQVWLSKVDWDDTLPVHISTKWKEIRKNLLQLSKVKIPRLICHSLKNVQLHGFSDASEAAYGAVIYCRTVTDDGNILVNVVTAKSKVSPLKQVSLPRLELCAALLLTRLITKVTDALSLEDVKIYTWTDSSIVLSWLSDTPRRWKSYVANRTAEILNVIPRNSWRYVPSADNPADIVSRGICPSHLHDCKLWWQGPSWLSKDPSTWPKGLTNNCAAEARNEERKMAFTSNFEELSSDVLSHISSRCSSWTRLIRILCYIQRFIVNLRQAKEHREHGFLKTYEIQRSSTKIIKWMQSQAFSNEIKHLSTGKQLPSKSSLISLYPFLDDEGVLRVGGRLENSSVSYNIKHPKILPQHHEVTRLLVREMHFKYLHPGISLLISIIRQEYWILRLRQLVKQITHNCTTCFRHRSNASQQLMGNLPKHRVNIGRPFMRSGLDFAGPVTILTKFGRSVRASKGYIALFVCFSTKALHLELVSSLTSESFIAALRRFSSRRGIPSDLYSDNGTNFVGANRTLLELQKSALSCYNSCPLIADFLSQNSIKWHFIPPAAPHFGGLWEAGVKSVKSHLRRVIGDTKLTFEEMTTLLAQIESILNSRPLCQVSDEVESLDVLTPSHFLVGQALTTLPEPDFTETKVTKLGRWQHLQAMMQGFWKRWSRDYLTSLQQRPKWQQLQSPLEVNQLVIVSEDNIPPSRWVLGRITEVHPGTDGLVRVVTLRTAKGLIKRPISRVHRLPIHT